MRGSFQIAKFFNIPVYIHWTFLLLFAYIFYLVFEQPWDWISLSVTLLSVLLLFVCVVLHEYGHALMARRYGVHTRDIILFPIGGVARLDGLPEKPMQEFYIAIAGPLVNVGILVLLLPYLCFVPTETLEAFRSILRGYFGIRDNVFPENITPVDILFFGLLMLNATLAVFNMLPAFPMDGGRVLRALLSLRLGRALATRIAAYIGQFLAILLLAYGVWNDYQWSIIFIGIFVFMTAASENRMVRAEYVLENHVVADIIRTYFTKIYVYDSMLIATQALQHGLEKDFLVLDETGNVRGILTEKSILQALKEKSVAQPVAQFMSEAYEPLLLNDTLKKAFSIVQWEGYPICPVYNETQELTGVVDETILQNFLHAQQKFGKLIRVEGRG